MCVIDGVWAVEIPNYIFHIILSENFAPFDCYINDEISLKK